MRGIHLIDVNKMKISFKRAIENSIKFDEHDKARVKNSNNDYVTANEHFFAVSLRYGQNE